MVIQELVANEALPTILLCKIAGVTRAAYYKWLNRQPSKREVENEQLLESIQLIYSQVEGIYGYRRITMTINRHREKANLPRVNKKRIYRLMKISRLKSVIRRKRKNIINPTRTMWQKIFLSVISKQKNQIKNGVQMSQNLNMVIRNGHT